LRLVARPLPDVKEEAGAHLLQAPAAEDHEGPLPSQPESGLEGPEGAVGADGPAEACAPGLVPELARQTKKVLGPVWFGSAGGRLHFEWGAQWRVGGLVDELGGGRDL